MHCWVPLIVMEVKPLLENVIAVKELRQIATGVRSKNVNVNILFQIQAQIIFSQTTFRRNMKWN